MAIVRCIDHIPQGRQEAYIISLEPVGYPETAAICGRVDCGKPGLVWLIADEHAEYLSGQRIFDVKTNSIMVQVK